jgi:hypothetical protein
VLAQLDAQFDAAAALPQAEFYGIVAVLLALTLAALYFGFQALIGARWIADLPTSRIASAAQGYLELEGNTDVLPGPRIISPLTGTPCAWWWYKIEKKVTRYRNGRRQTTWQTIEHQRSDELFLLRDGTGECIVDPDGARVIPSLRRSWTGTSRHPAAPPPTARRWLQFGNHRYSEQLLQLGDAVYALGYFRTQHGVQDFDERSDLRELLAQWKADHPGLIARFDADGDGQISVEEWEAARRAALKEVRQRHVEQAVTPDFNVLSRPPDRRPFLLSSVPQDHIRRSKQRQGWALITASILLFAVLATLIQARLAMG